MANEVLYPADAVLKMLIAAYQAGFEGPLEMSEEACRDIMTRGTYTESDLDLMKHMQEREHRRNTIPVPPARRRAVPASGQMLQDLYGDG